MGPLIREGSGGRRTSKSLEIRTGLQTVCQFRAEARHRRRGQSQRVAGVRSMALPLRRPSPRRVCPPPRRPCKDSFRLVASARLAITAMGRATKGAADRIRDRPFPAARHPATSREHRDAGGFQRSRRADRGGSIPRPGARSATGLLGGEPGESTGERGAPRLRLRGTHTGRLRQDCNSGGGGPTVLRSAKPWRAGKIPSAAPCTPETRARPAWRAGDVGTGRDVETGRPRDASRPTTMSCPKIRQSGEPTPQRRAVALTHQSGRAPATRAAAARAARRSS